MTTAKDFMELQIYRRRCGPSNDIETPSLIDASARDETVQEGQSATNEEPSTPFPKCWLLLAMILAGLFISTAVTIGFLQASENKENWSLSFFPLPLSIDVILVTCFFAMLVVYIRMTEDDVKSTALFVVFFAVGVILGLGMETLALITTPDTTREARNNPLLVVWFNMFFFIGCFSLAAILGGKCDDETARLCWLRYYWYLSFTLGWMIGVFMGVVLALSIFGHQGVLAAPTLLSIQLAFFGAGTAAYFLAVNFRL
jgi:hypothetical protein